MSPSIGKGKVTLVVWERLRRQALGLDMYVCVFLLLLFCFVFFFEQYLVHS